MKNLKLSLFILPILLLFACKKQKEENIEVIGNNNAPYYDKIPRVKIENYVNRLFIDIIGREPLDAEQNEETNKLIAANLSQDARETLILKLQTDQTYRPGDSSYCIAFHKRLYDLLCVRLCEGIGEQDFLFHRGIQEFACLQDSLDGDWNNFYEGKRNSRQLLQAAKARWDFMHDSIKIEKYCERLVNNTVTFYKTLSYAGNEDNTIKYTFNDYLFRNYTDNEFAVSRTMILEGKPAILLGVSGSSKGDYFEIITHSQEFYEGTIKWLYKTFLSRYPTTQEIMQGMDIMFTQNKDIIKIQRNILKTDEYANF